MWRTPQQLLLSYAGLLVALGAILALADGFANGWRIVGANVALLCVIAAVIAHLGGQWNRSKIRTAGAALGMIVCAAASLNFLRLAIKWQRAEFVFDLAPVIAGVMALGGFAVAVLLWRFTISPGHRNWSVHLKRITAACGVLAIAAGLFISKTVTAPQSASAMLDTAVAAADLVERVTDVDLTDRVVQEALNSESVQQALIERGLNERQIEQLAANPELRAAAADVLRSGLDSESEIDLTQLAAAINTDLGQTPGGETSASGSMETPMPAKAELLAMFSEAELRQLARSMNINPAEFSGASSASGQFDPQLIEQFLASNPGAGATAVSPQSTIDDHLLDPVAARDGPMRTQRSMAAERVRAESLSQRVVAERYVGAGAPGLDGADLNNRDNAAVDSSEVESPTATLQFEYLPVGLLDARAAEPQPDSILVTADAFAARRSVPTAESEAHAAQPTAAAATGEARELATIVEAARREYLGSTTQPAFDMSALADPETGPGALLNRLGLVVVAIGVALVLCALAIGRIAPARTI